MLNNEDLHNIEFYTKHASPGPWEFGKLDRQTIEDHISLVSDLLAKRMGTTVWYVLKAHEGKDAEDEPLIIAMTGNGPASEANAKFLTMARDVIPALMADQHAMPHLISALQAAYRTYVQLDETMSRLELGTRLMTALCEAMGDEAFQAWVHEIDVGTESSSR